MSEYSHRQSGPWGLVSEALGLGTVGVVLWRAFQGRLDTGPAVCLGTVGCVFLLCAGLFSYLEARDTGDRLSVRFGPIHLFGTSIRYDTIESIEAARTSLADGFGMHGVPAFYVVYNIWGFHAVRIRLKKRAGLWRVRTVLIGTDEPQALAAFLQAKLMARAAEDG